MYYISVIIILLLISSSDQNQTHLEDHETRMHATSLKVDTEEIEFFLKPSLKHFKGIFSPIKEPSFQYYLCSEGAISNRYSCRYLKKYTVETKV